MDGRKSKYWNSFSFRNTVEFSLDLGYTPESEDEQFVTDWVRQRISQDSDSKISIQDFWDFLKEKYKFKGPKIEANNILLRVKLNSEIWKPFLNHFCIRNYSLEEQKSLAKYGCKHPNQTEESIAKKKQTIIKKYGVENVSQSDFIKNKKRETFMKHYGRPNKPVTEEQKEKTRQTCLEKYGSESYFGSDKFKKEVRPFMKCSEEQKEKRRRTNIKKYGFSTPLGNPEYHKIFMEKVKEKFGCYPGRIGIKKSIETRKEKAKQRHALDAKNTKSDKFSKYSSGHVYIMRWEINGEILVKIGIGNTWRRCKCIEYLLGGKLIGLYETSKSFKNARKNESILHQKFKSSKHLVEDVKGLFVEDDFKVFFQSSGKTEWFSGEIWDESIDYLKSLVKEYCEVVDNLESYNSYFNLNPNSVKFLGIR